MPFAECEAAAGGVDAGCGLTGVREAGAAVLGEVGSLRMSFDGGGRGLCCVFLSLLPPRPLVMM